MGKKCGIFRLQSPVHPAVYAYLALSRGDKNTIPQGMVQGCYESVDWTTGHGLDPPFKNEVPRLLESGK